MTGQTAIPVWSLDEVFPGFESEAYRSAKDEVKTMLETMRRHLAEAEPPRGETEFSDWLFDLLGRLDRLEVLASTLSAYVYARSPPKPKITRCSPNSTRSKRCLSPQPPCGCSFETSLRDAGTA